MSKAVSPTGLPSSLTGGAARRRYPSDATRVERRRLQRTNAPRELTPQERFAGRLLELAQRAPDEQSRDELNRVVHNLRLRFSGGAGERRFAVVANPPRVRAGVTTPTESASEEERRALDFAQELMFLGDQAPDEQADREINAVVRGIKLRFTSDEHRQRLAVLKALESSELLSLAEVVEITRLGEGRVLSILSDFTDPETGLAFESTPDGKRRCGRAGTTRYFGLKH